MVYSISLHVPYEKYPTVEFLDGELEEIDLAGPDSKEKQILKIINKQFLYLLGMKVEIPNPPRTWQWRSAKKLLDYYTPDSFPMVSDRFKSIIEVFEPDVHQFFPVQVVDKKKEPLAERWLWNVCNRIDSVDREHTTYIQKRGGFWSHPDRIQDADLPASYNRSVAPKMVFSNERIGRAHFWRDPNLLMQHLYCSAPAGDALLSGKFTGLELTKWESV